MTKSEILGRIDGFIRNSPVKIVKQIHANIDQNIAEMFFPSENIDANLRQTGTNEIFFDNPTANVSAFYIKTKKIGNTVFIDGQIFISGNITNGSTVLSIKNDKYFPKTYTPITNNTGSTTAIKQYVNGWINQVNNGALTKEHFCLVLDPVTNTLVCLGDYTVGSAVITGSYTVNDN